jgi:hypothetical protein
MSKALDADVPAGIAFVTIVPRMVLEAYSLQPSVLVLNIVRYLCLHMRHLRDEDLG